MHGSYVRRCSIHRSYNGAIVLDRVQGVVLDENVAFDIRGHAIRVGSTGAETGHVISNNLVAVVRPVWSLLLTEQTPAAFYVRNPANYFRDNTVAGSSHHGFWFHVPRTPDLAAAGSQGIASGSGVAQCPRRVPLGSFEGNSVHSVGGAAVWFSQPWFPSSPFEPVGSGIGSGTRWSSLDGLNRADGPEGSCHDDTRPSPALLHNTVVYKVSGPALRGVAFGAVGVDGLVAADVLGSGVEVQFWGGDEQLFTPFIRRSLFVDRSPNAYAAARSVAAVHLPGLTSGLVIEDSIMVGFNRSIRSCYGCLEPHTGGYEASFGNLTFYPASSIGLDETDVNNVTTLMVRDEEVDGISSTREGYMGWS